MAAQPKTSLVTGGAGFIGSNLVKALADAGERVRVVDDLSTGFWENLGELRGSERVECITADIRDAEAMNRAAVGVDVIFHQAALGSVPRSIDAPVTSDAVNTGGTVTVLDAARRNGVRRVVFAASSAAYGDTPTLPKREDMPISPLSPYAVTKVADELYMKVFASLYGIETVCLRYFNVFGPNQRPDGAYAAAIPRFVWAALHGDALTVYGDGEQTRDFCYVDNAVSANLLAAGASRKLTGEVMNIAGGRRISLNALITEIGRVLGSAPKVQNDPPRLGDVRDSLADVSRAKELIGYEPKVRWEAGIAPTVAYLRALAASRGAA
ncbi:MAG: SDR family oxidoreductase [Polyangiaceae bacterium]|nr:SDR family oxidoreductase [Polyangiaceae bacterium]